MHPDKVPHPPKVFLPITLILVYTLNIGTLVHDAVIAL